MSSRTDLSKLSRIRVGDTERRGAVAALSVHLGSGRLRLPEYQQRLDRIAKAHSRGGISAVFTDLPAPHPDLSDPRRAKRRERAAGLLGLVENLLNCTLVFGVPVAVMVGFSIGSWGWLWLTLTAFVGLTAVASK